MRRIQPRRSRWSNLRKSASGNDDSFPSWFKVEACLLSRSEIQDQQEFVEVVSEARDHIRGVTLLKPVITRNFLNYLRQTTRASSRFVFQNRLFLDTLLDK